MPMANLFPFFSGGVGGMGWDLKLKTGQYYGFILSAKNMQELIVGHVGMGAANTNIFNINNALFMFSIPHVFWLIKSS